VKEIGRRLQAARDAKGISLQNVEEETRIRRKYLEALEGGNEANLPGEAYLKGFLRTYGNFLGLDGPALVEQYKAHKGPSADVAATGSVEVAAPAQPAMASEHPARPEPHVSRPEIRPASHFDRAPLERTQPRRRTNDSWIYSRQAGQLAVATLVIAAVAYGGWQVFSQVSAKPTVPPAPPVQAPPKPVETTPTPVPTKQPDPVKTIMTRGEREQVNFAVTAKEIQVRLEPGAEPVWMQAFVDGKDDPAFEGYPQGPIEFKGSRIRLRMGHMDGVSLVVNGQRFDKPLERGPYWLNFTGQ
jgi:transcriptional regulator with XRE-family HTH domain